MATNQSSSRSSLWAFGFGSGSSANRNTTATLNESETSDSEEPPRKGYKRNYQSKWAQKWPWIMYDKKMSHVLPCVFKGKVFVSSVIETLYFFPLEWPRVSDDKCAFVKGTNNFSNCHSIQKLASDKHQLAVEADLAANAPEKTPMVQAVARLTQQQNDKMLLLFCTAYCIVKQKFSLNSFAALLCLQKMNGMALGSAYSNGKVASTFIN